MGVDENSGQRTARAGKRNSAIKLTYEKNNQLQQAKDTFEKVYKLSVEQGKTQLAESFKNDYERVSAKLIAAIASRPLAHSPTISISGSLSRYLLIKLRTNATSSTINVLIFILNFLLERVSSY